MLIITQSLFAAHQRPKWTPRNRWAQSTVRDTENGQVVFGPATRNYCQAYIDRTNKKLKGV